MPSPVVTRNIIQEILANGPTLTPWTSRMVVHNVNFLEALSSTPIVRSGTGTVTDTPSPVMGTYAARSEAGAATANKIINVLYSNGSATVADGRTIVFRAALNFPALNPLGDNVAGEGLYYMGLRQLGSLGAGPGASQLTVAANYAALVLNTSGLAAAPETGLSGGQTLTRFAANDWRWQAVTSAANVEQVQTFDASTNLARSTGADFILTILINPDRRPVYIVEKVNSANTLSSRASFAYRGDQLANNTPVFPFIAARNASTAGTIDTPFIRTWSFAYTI